MNFSAGNTKVAFRLLLALSRKEKMVLTDRLNSVIGDGDLVGVTRQVLDDRTGIFERHFRMHPPIGFIEFFLQFPEVAILFQGADLPFQGQLLVLVKLDELFEELAPECLG